MLAFTTASQVVFSQSVCVPHTWTREDLSCDMGNAKLRSWTLTRRINGLLSLATGTLISFIFYRELSTVDALCLSGVVFLAIIMYHPTTTQRNPDIELDVME